MNAKHLRDLLGRRRGAMVKKNKREAEQEAAAAVAGSKRDLSDARRKVTVLREKLTGGEIPVPDYMLGGSTGTKLYNQFAEIVDLWGVARVSADPDAYQEAIDAVGKSYDFFRSRYEKTLDSKKRSSESGGRGKDYKEMAQHRLSMVADLYKDFMGYVEDTAMPMLKEEKASADAGSPKFTPVPEEPIGADAELVDELAQAEAKAVEIRKGIGLAYESALRAAQAKRPDPSAEEVVENLVEAGYVDDYEADALRRSLLIKTTVYPTRQDIEAALRGEPPPL